MSAQNEVCIHQQCMAEAGGCINFGSTRCYLTYRDQDDKTPPTHARDPEAVAT